MKGDGSRKPVRVRSYEEWSEAQTEPARYYVHHLAYGEEIRVNPDPYGSSPLAMLFQQRLEERHLSREGLLAFAHECGVQCDEDVFEELRGAINIMYATVHGTLALDSPVTDLQKDVYSALSTLATHAPRLKAEAAYAVRCHGAGARGISKARESVVNNLAQAVEDALGIYSNPAPGKRTALWYTDVRYLAHLLKKMANRTGTQPGLANETGGGVELILRVTTWIGLSEQYKRHGIGREETSITAGKVLTALRGRSDP